MKKIASFLLSITLLYNVGLLSITYASIQQITTVNTGGSNGYSKPITTSDGLYIFYANSSDGNKLYKKGINEVGNGTAFTSASVFYSPVLTSDGLYIFYANSSDGNKLYKKGINEVGNGTAFTSAGIYYNPQISSDGYIYYIIGGGWRVYRKLITDTSNSNGTQMTTLQSYVNGVADVFSISPDGSTLLYINSSNGKVYKKGINESGNGGIFIDYNVTGNGVCPKFSPDGSYVYYVPSDGFGIYKKMISDTNITNLGDILTPISSLVGFITSDGRYFIYYGRGEGNIYIKKVTDNGKGDILIRGVTVYERTFNLVGGGKYILYSDMWTSGIFMKDIYFNDGDSNGDSSSYILNILNGSNGNMQQLNVFSSSISFSNHTQVKSNFLANYSYMQSWYESKGLTINVINNNVDWANGVTFSKTDVAGGMLDGYKLSAHYPFMSYKETDNNDNSIFWRTDLSNTSFQTDTTWTNVGIPAYPIKNGNGTTIAYLEFPCGNLICKDQYCSDIQKITNLTPINPILPGTCNNNGVIDLMDEVCDGDDGVRHDLGETCNSSCQLISSTGSIIGCPTVPAFGYKCDGTTQIPIFPVDITPTPPGENNSVVNTGSIINWTPPDSIIIPNIGDINTNTGMTDTEKIIAEDIVCSVLNEGFKVSKSIIVTNTMADTSLISRLRGKDEFLKTLSGSSFDVAERVIQKRIKSSKLNQKSNLYDFGYGGTISGIQFNLSEISDSAVIRKLVELAIDHSSTTMADYEQTIQDSCNNSSIVTGKEVVPAGFIDVNEKGETILNLFRFNG